nr:sugar transferase [Sphingomonas colocasiae]
MVPWLLRIEFAEHELEQYGLQASMIATALAFLTGTYILKKLARYPGVRSSYYILPSFATTYAVALSAFFFVRFDYSRLHFLISFLLTIAWFYIVYFKTQREARLALGVVPYGNFERILTIPEVDWTILNERESPVDTLDGIVVDLRAELPDEWERYISDRAIDGMLVMHVKQIEESLTGRVDISHLSENNLGSLIPGLLYGKVKRIVDVVVSIALLPVLIPALGVVAMLIRMDSPGPVIFRQTRMGYRGRPFTMWKFRTMTDRTVAPGDGRQDAITRDGDARVTRIGRFLRQYRVDELPQVVNILRGEMSWIGPRPEAMPLSKWYETELPFYRYRHIVRPGISGWAQVRQGHVAEVDEVLWKLQYDFYYIKNFSFWLDCLIVAGTLRTVWSGFGAR